MQTRDILQFGFLSEQEKKTKLGVMNHVDLHFSKGPVSLKTESTSSNISLFQNVGSDGVDRSFTARVENDL